MSELPEHIITAYLDGELPQEERDRFEAQLAEDPALAEAVAQQRQLRSLLSSYQADATEREQIRYLYHQLPTEEAGKTRRFPLWQIGLAIAASIALLLWVFWPAPTASISTEALLAQSFSPAPAPERMGSTKGDMMEILAEAHQTYSETAYPQAIGLYQQVLQDSTYRPEAAFFLAQSYLATRQYEQAEAALQWVNNRTQEVIWFSALAKLGQEDIEGCKQLLNSLATNPSYDYHEEAKQLLEQLPK